MKKIVTAIVIFFLNSVSFADDQERELDKLFLELKKNIVCVRYWRWKYL